MRSISTRSIPEPTIMLSMKLNHFPFVVFAHTPKVLFRGGGAASPREAGTPPITGARYCGLSASVVVSKPVKFCSTPQQWLGGGPPPRIGGCEANGPEPQRRANDEY